ncbi:MULTISPECIES: helix-turn-helix domain-containing protein [Serratia]|uniref:helix-turn-helix domain-containing protein n=1 Tax=Serratia TaxID=613 RepID=UPI001013C3A3|nr:MULTISPECIES: helix-turn-helix transcriptional regulator [Serratia]
MKTNKPVNHSTESGKVNIPLPLPVERAIRKLGSDVALARRRRRISQASLAERIGASVSTVRRMEKGDARVPIHFFARALHVFGEIQALAGLLDTARDDIGLTLMDENLPKRVRSKAGRSGAL